MAGKKGSSGRKAGTPNRATLDARRAIADFVDSNTHRLQDWLDKVAEGVPKLGPDGKPVYNDNGMPMWDVPPNPEKAYQLMQSVIEYHVPKVARKEISGPDGGPITLSAMDLTGLSDGELAQMQALLGKAAGG